MFSSPGNWKDVATLATGKAPTWNPRPSRSHLALDVFTLGNHGKEEEIAGNCDHEILVP